MTVSPVVLSLLPLIALILLPIYLLGAAIATALVVVTVLGRHPASITLPRIAAATLTIAAAAAAAAGAAHLYQTVPGAVFFLAVAVCVTAGAVAGSLSAALHLIPRATERTT